MPAAPVSWTALSALSTPGFSCPSSPHPLVARSSWWLPPTGQMCWTPRSCGPAGWTERSRSHCPTSRQAWLREGLPRPHQAGCLCRIERAAPHRVTEPVCPRRSLTGPSLCPIRLPCPAGAHGDSQDPRLQDHQARRHRLRGRGQVSPWGQRSSGTRELGTGAHCTAARCSVAGLPNPISRFRPAATDFFLLSPPAHPPTLPFPPQAGRQLQRRRPAQHLHRGGHVCHSR